MLPLLTFLFYFYLDTSAFKRQVPRPPPSPVCIGEARFITVTKKKGSGGGGGGGGDGGELPPMLQLGQARDVALDTYFSRHPPTAREVDTAMAAAIGGGMHAAAELVTQKRHKVQERYRRCVKIDSAAWQAPSGLFSSILSRVFFSANKLPMGPRYWCIAVSRSPVLAVSLLVYIFGTAPFIAPLVVRFPGSATRQAGQGYGFTRRFCARAPASSGQVQVSRTARCVVSLGVGRHV